MRPPIDPSQPASRASPPPSVHWAQAKAKTAWTIWYWAPVVSRVLICGPAPWAALALVVALDALDDDAGAPAAVGPEERAVRELRRTAAEIDRLLASFD